MSYRKVHGRAKFFEQGGGASLFNYSELKELIGLIDSSGINDFELKIDNVSLHISKGGKPLPNGASSAPESAAVPGDGVIAAEREANPLGHIIRSPIVATYYESAGPDKPPFVKLGDRVKKGDVLCILEAMKIMNEITSGLDGEIAEIYLQNGEIAEYNSPLFRIV